MTTPKSNNSTPPCQLIVIAAPEAIPSFFPLIEQERNVHIFEQTDLAFQFIHQQIYEASEPSLSNAILIDLDLLIKENYRFLKTIRLDPVYKNFPFLVLKNNDSELDISKALKMGIDDAYYYDHLHQWQRIYIRIDFLNKYKKDLSKFPVSRNEDLIFKTPPGKRFFDVVFSMSALILLSPLFLIIALLIKVTSEGPIIYRSKRVGQGYETIDFLKFRSMVADADTRLASLQHLNQYNYDNDIETSFVKIKNDPRITRIGRIIRKTSLDELPQFINVLRGEMSVVGNRPLPIYEAEHMTNEQWAGRFISPAGITGLWQVRADKDAMSTEDRIEYDLIYSYEYNWFMDWKIILRTPRAMIQRGE